MKELRSKEYDEFLKTRLPHRKNLIKILRIGLSFALIIYIALRLALKEKQFFDAVIVPVILGFHIISSSLVLRKRFEPFTSWYLTIILSLKLNAGIYVVVNDTSQRVVTIFLGMVLGILFTILVISKLPFKHLIVSSLILFTHMIIRIHVIANSPSILTPILFAVLVTLVACIQIGQELVEFKLWKNLGSSHLQLQSFQKLLENFPTKILVFGNKSSELLYMNDEVKGFIIKELGRNSVEDLLRGFRLDAGQTLLELISKADLSASSNPEKIFEVYFASYNVNLVPGQSIGCGQTNEVELTQDLHHSKAPRNEEPVQQRYEIKIGKLKWGEVEGALVVILNDISKSEKIRELKLLHENKDKMLATVSHELRTPLNGIIGMIDLANEEIDSSGPVAKYLKIAKNSAKTLLLMINDILDVSQIEKGTLRLSLQEVRVHDIITQVLPLVKIQTIQKDLDLRYENCCSSFTSVLADPMRFQQILLNLLVNACKFTNDGHITVRVRPKEEKKGSAHIRNFSEADKLLKQSESILSLGEEKIELIPELSPRPQRNNNNKIVISVEDSGLGISKDKISSLFRLFAKFEQRGNSTGVGLGLGISQQLASQMNFGRIKVQSEVNKGSRFWFSLKTIENAQAAPSYIFSDLLSHSPSFKIQREVTRSREDVHTKEREFKVLIVDDDQINHLVIEEYIKSLGVSKWKKAYNGQQGLDFFLEAKEGGTPFDIVLMDCNMPVMDGFEATEKIRRFEQEKGEPKTRIIALTANVSVVDKENCLRRGMDQVWTKPLLKKEFLEKMKTAMGK